ncbi:hypothetical protein [Natrialba sp. PRR66]|uniref:DUF7521 family protein n=1 Tax=Natrialba sp. PRR66 TaxID=3098146 RepID=UPI002B1E5E91|nr:hypothetical protein [Natrialba sp. PRR66]
MHFLPPLQTMGGSRLVVILSFLGLFITAALALVVAFLIVRGYRRNRDDARLYLAIGLVLLTTGPIIIQFVLANVTEISMVGRSASANASKLLGLGAILYAIYGLSRNRESTGDNDSDRPNRVRRR